MKTANININGIELEVSGVYSPEEEETNTREVFEVDEVIWLKNNGYNEIAVDITDIYCSLLGEHYETIEEMCIENIKNQ